MSLDIPQTILKPLDVLISNPSFCEQISNYTKDGLKALYGL
jgi:hypothetical protein